MEIKKAASGSNPISSVNLRPQIEPVSKVEKAVGFEGSKSDDEVALGRLGSTLFTNGKALSPKEARKLSTAPPSRELEKSDGESRFSDLDLNHAMVLGGPDSPCFYNGKVMTTREANALREAEKTLPSPD